jgi:hypothetical protein
MRAVVSANRTAATRTNHTAVVLLPMGYLGLWGVFSYRVNFQFAPVANLGILMFLRAPALWRAYLATHAATGEDVAGPPQYRQATRT